jgi:hypothetical protein
MMDTIRNAWGWTGLDPVEVVNANPFGNLIVKAVDGAYWRICPESLTCEKVADNSDKFTKVWNDEKFRFDWEMLRLVAVAEKKLGVLQQGRSYCFKLSPVVGGTYDAAIAINNNIGRLCRQEGLGWRWWAGLGGAGF